MTPREIIIHMQAKHSLTMPALATKLGVPLRTLEEWKANKGASKGALAYLRHMQTCKMV